MPFKTSYGKIFVKVNKTRSRPEIIIIYGGLFKSYFSATGPISANEIRGFPGISVAEHMDIENVRVVYPFPEQYADATGEKSTNTIEYVLHYNQETKRM